MKFRTSLQLEGKTATGLLIPDDVVAALGQSRKPAVTVTVDGPVTRHTYRSTVAARGDRYLLPVSADIRKITGLSAGDEVDVELQLDTAVRKVEVPADLAALLDSEPAVKVFFETLSYSNQLAHTLSIDAAKTAETRQRRVEKAMDTLRSGRAR